MIKRIIKLLNQYKRLVKFGIAGVTATAAQFFVLAFFTEIVGWHYLASATIGYFIAFWVSFLLQKFWTFRDNSRERFARQVAYYFGLLVTGVSINAGGMFVLVEYAGIHYLLAQLFMSAMVAVLNYLINKYIIFAHAVREHEAPKDGKTVLIATPIFPPVIGGPATYVATLCEELPRHGYSVNVVTYGNDIKSEILNSKSETNSKLEILNPKTYKLITINKNQGFFSKYLEFFLAIWRHAPAADIIYLQDPVNAGWPAGLACFLRAKPYIIKIVGDYAWEHAQECHGVTDRLDEFQNKKYGFKVELIRFIQRWVVRNAETVISPSNYLKGIVKGWGIADGKIRVIYNSVKEASVGLNRDEARSKHGLSGRVLISVGRLLPWKGFVALIDIMPELLKSESDLRLIIIGDGPERKNTEEYIASSPAKDRITFIPGLPQAELWEYIKAADVFILNTGYEGLPHLVIEAQMLGTPVITTAAGGNSEVATDGVNGLIVGHDNKEEIMSAIRKVLNDKELSRHLVENGKLGLDKFNREKMVNDLITIFSL